MPGDHAEWVVLEPVHQAVEVLRQLNDDPGHLFGYAHGSRDYLTSAVTTRLAAFRDHAVSLFSQAGGPFIPYDGDQPWAFNSRQFRRTLAWHIAHQPFGVIAGARQYHHAKLVMFEGYAVFQDDLIRTYRAYLDKRRAALPEAEYREPTAGEWREFEEHFEKRKLELGTCGRPYGTPCAHGHARLTEMILSWDASRPRRWV
jgi:hypothetical protein